MTTSIGHCARISVACSVVAAVRARKPESETTLRQRSRVASSSSTISIEMAAGRSTTDADWVPEAGMRHSLSTAPMAKAKRKPMDDQSIAENTALSYSHRSLTDGTLV